MMVCRRQGWANAAVASAISRGADCWEGCIGSEADFHRNVRMWREENVRPNLHRAAGPTCDLLPWGQGSSKAVCPIGRSIGALLLVVSPTARFPTLGPPLKLRSLIPACS